MAKAAALSLTLFAVAVGCGPAHEEGRPFNAPAITSANPGRDSDLVGSAKDAQKKPDQVGLATWYGESFAGKKTASGEKFDPTQMTAAHRKLPFGTWVEVRRIDTGAVVRVRITDRGPWGDDKKIIDLARAAADRIGLREQGITKVELRIVNGPE